MHYDQPVGILGGTFDPIHYAHIKLANAVLKALQLARVHFIPNYHPSHRQPTVASAHDRFTMVKLALASYTNLICDDTEIKRGGISYMIDTLIQLKQQYPNTPLCLLVGADVFAKLDTWHRWQELFTYAHLISIARPNAALPTSAELESIWQSHRTESIEDLHKHLAGKIYVYHHEVSNLSATRIRQKLQAKEDISADIPTSVAEYIQKHQLYTQPS